MTAYQSAQVAIRAFQDAKRARASIVRFNAGLRMSGKAHLVQPLPELPAKPVKFLLEGHDGSYIGTEWDSEFAHDYAAEHDCKITTLPFDA
jgi:hypothetical protein